MVNNPTESNLYKLGLVKIISNFHNINHIYLFSYTFNFLSVRNLTVTFNRDFIHYKVTSYIYVIIDIFVRTLGRRSLHLYTISRAIVPLYNMRLPYAKDDCNIKVWPEFLTGNAQVGIIIPYKKNCVLIQE